MTCSKTGFSLFLGLLGFSASLLGCGDEVDADQDILAIGDSLLSSHTPEDDIASVAARELNLSVGLGAIGGTTLLDSGDSGIPQTYLNGAFRVLIVSGGGNDLGSCDCGGGCGDVLDAMLSEDATTGAVVDLVDEAVSDGKKVAWIGYMRPQADAEEFADCGGELDIYRARLSMLDATQEDLVFVDGAEIGTGVETELYAPDGYHPSEAGSLALGQALAISTREAFNL